MFIVNTDGCLPMFGGATQLLKAILKYVCGRSILNERNLFNFCNPALRLVDHVSAKNWDLRGRVVKSSVHDCLLAVSQMHQQVMDRLFHKRGWWLTLLLRCLWRRLSGLRWRLRSLSSKAIIWLRLRRRSLKLLPRVEIWWTLRASSWLNRYKLDPWLRSLIGWLVQLLQIILRYRLVQWERKF